MTATFNPFAALALSPIQRAEALIKSLLASKGVISFGAALEIVQPGAKYVPSTTGELISLFASAKPGADALLVDSTGKYSSSAPVFAHAQFLSANGYSAFPEVKAPKAKIKPAKGFFTLG